MFRRMTVASLLVVIVAGVFSWYVLRTRRSQWTVMFYMNGDNAVEQQALNEFLELAKAGSSADVNIVVQLDRHEENATGYGDWTQTRRFLVQAGMTPTLAESIQGFDEESNMSDGATLKAFVEWARWSYPAQRYALVIWDHGFGAYKMQNVLLSLLSAGDTARAEKLFKELTRLGFSLNLPLNIAPSSESPATLLPLLGRSAVPWGDLSLPAATMLDSDRGAGQDFLYNEEAAKAIEDAVAGDPLDLLVLHACDMSMLEVAYTMRKTADFMVASPYSIPPTGWLMETWIGPLKLTPQMSGEDLGHLLVDQYPIHPLDTMKAITLVALAHAASLAKAVDILAGQLVGLVRAGDICPLVSTAITDAYGIGSADLMTVATALMAAPFEASQASTRAASAQVLAHFKKAVISVRAPAAAPRNGLAIYYPAVADTYLTREAKEYYSESNTVWPLTFVADYRWDNFLASLHADKGMAAAKCP